MKDSSTEIMAGLEQVFQDVLDDDSIRLTTKTTANDLADWDSVNHLVLLHAIERKYNIKFSLDEMINCRSLGDICDRILKKE